MNSHALGNSGRSLPRPSPELCSGHVCSPQAGRAGAQLLCTGGSPRQAGLSSSHGGGEWAPGVPAKHSQPVSERAKRQGQDCLVPKQVLGMAGLFCHETWWRGETQQREKGAPGAGAGRGAAPCLSERQMPRARSRSGHCLPHRPSVLAPPAPAPSPRPTEGAGTTYGPKTSCPGHKQIRASGHGRRGADGAPRRCQVQKRTSGTQ